MIRKVDITRDKGLVSKLTLLSRYMFVTTEKQAKELLKLVETPGTLSGLLILMDGHLVLSRRHAYKLTVALTYLVCRNRQLNIGILIVKNPEDSLDKRIERQLTHSSKIVSTEWPKEVTL